MDQCVVDLGVNVRESDAVQGVTSVFHWFWVLKTGFSSLQLFYWLYVLFQTPEYQNTTPEY